MVRFGMVAAAMALMASPLLAQESTEQLKKELDELRAKVEALSSVNSTKEIPAQGKIDANAMAADDSPVMTLFKGSKLSGFVDTAYQFSFNQLHSTVNNDNPIRAFDDRDNSFYLHNVQLQLERLATKDMIVGYHVELHAGHDAEITSGSEVSLQEGWLQILAPLGNGVDIRVGRMASLIGYEVVENTNNLNYTRGAVWTLLEPITTTGVRVAYSFVEQFSASIGFSNGLNFAANDQFEDENHGKMFEVQLLVKPIKDLWIALNMNVGGADGSLGGTASDKYYVFNIVAEYKLDKLTAAVNFTQESFQTGGARNPARGLAAYLRYQVTDVYAPGVRVEYVGTGVPGNSRFVTFTFTNELKVAQHLILRIELRADNSNNQDFSRDVNTAKGDYTLGFEALLPF